MSAATSRPLAAPACVLALLAAGLTLVHAPAVLAGGPGWHSWPGFATTTVLDRTGPQLLAAALAGAATTALTRRCAPPPSRAPRAAIASGARAGARTAP